MDGVSSVTRWHAVTLLLFALLVAAFAVLQRGLEIRVPESGGIDPFRNFVAPQKPERVRAAERPVAPPPRSVRASVTSTDGTPIPGARIELVRGPEQESWDRVLVPSVDAPRAEHAVACDEDGCAVSENIAPGRWFVVGSAPGFARHVVAGVTRGDDDLGVDTTVALARGHAFAGTIRNPDGAPAGGVVVVLEPRDAVAWPDDVACLRTTTTKDGAYRFECVEADRYRLWYAVRPGFLVEAAQVVVPSLDGLDVRMTTGAVIEGVVRDAATDVAVPGARVIAVRYEESGISGLSGRTTILADAVADHLGRYALPTWRSPTGVSYLVVDAPGYTPTPADGGGDAIEGPVRDGQRFTRDLRLRRAVAVKGTVSGPDGPIERLRVSAVPMGDGDVEQPLPTPWAWSCITDAAGRYRIEGLPPGPVQLTCMELNAMPGLIHQRDVELASGEDLVAEVRFEPERARVTRIVVDDEGNPVEGVEVEERIGPFHASARTDAEGRFTMDAWFGEGPVFVTLRRAGYVDMPASLSRDDDGGPMTPLPRAAPAAGTVVTSDGSRAPGVRVRLAVGFEGMHGESFPFWTGTRETVSGPDGAFRLPVTAGPGHWLRAPTDVEGPAQNDDGTWTITLPPSTRLAGRVVASDGGEPIAGALVRDTIGVVFARSGADGRFAFDTWTAGWNSFHVDADGRLPWLLLIDADEQRVELRPARSIAGVVRLADGSPATGVVVRASRPGESGEPFASATDRDGRFTVTGLDAEPCRLTIADPSHHALAARAVTVESGRSDVAIVAAPASLLVVEVVDADGNHVAAADVSAIADGSDQPDAVERTRPFGTVELGVVPDATYTIRVEREGYEPAERKDVKPGGGEPLRVVLRRTSPR